MAIEGLAEEMLGQVWRRRKQGKVSAAASRLSTEGAPVPRSCALAPRSGTQVAGGGAVQTAAPKVSWCESESGRELGEGWRCRGRRHLDHQAAATGGVANPLFLVFIQHK